MATLNPDIGMVPVQYQPLVLRLLADAREHLQSGGRLPSLYFIGSTEASALETVVVDTASGEAKDSAADHARRLATYLDADFVALLTEAWALPANKLQSYDQVIAKYGSIGAYPKRLDIVFLQLETRHGYFTATAAIRPVPPSKKRRQLGPVKWMQADDADGRLARILPKVPAHA